MLNYGCCPAGATTCLQIDSLSTSLGTVNLTTGQGVTFTGKVNNNAGVNTGWTVSVADRTISGTGNTITATWDGRDASGSQVQPGTYMAMVTARTDGSGCADSDSRSIPITVTATPEQCLRQDIGSTVNAASGSLNHSQTLFRLPYAKFMGEFILSYESFSSETAPLGRGWSHSFNIRLKQNNDQSYTLMEGDGKRTVLYPDGTRFRPQHSSYPVLTQEADGTYSLSHKNGLTYRFSHGRLITAVSDRNANTVSFAYDAGDNLMGIVDTAGRRITLSYNANRRINKITDPNRNVHRFHYAGDQMTGLSSRIAQLGTATWSYTYDNGGLLLTKTDPNAFTTTYAYNGEGRLARVTDPEGKIRSVTYYPQQSKSQITEKDGGIWTYLHDAANGTLTKKIDPLGNQTTYAYDKWNLQSVMDPRGNSTTYIYDDNENVASITDALGNVTTYAYNALNLVTGIGYPGDASVAMGYDARGNLTALTDPMGNTTRYTYDSKGNRLTATDALSRTTTFTYDAHNYLLTVTDPAAGVASYTYNESGNVKSYKDPLNHVTRYAYNGLNRIRKVTEPRGHVTTYAYDAAGNVKSLTDANGKTTHYEHTYNGRIARITDALGNRTEFAYSTGCHSCGTGVDKLTSLTDPLGRSTVFEYDAAGRLSAEYNPLGYFRTFTYDAAGNVTAMTDENGRTTHYRYDPLNRLTQAIYPDGTSREFAYSDRGKLAAAANAYLGYAFSYDLNDRITAVTRSDGRNVTYQYNEVNGRSRMTAPDGRTITYGYDPANRLQQIASEAGTFTFAHDAAGRRTGLAHPNGINTVYTYNAANDLTKVLARAGRKTIADSFTYTHDDVGNRTSLTDLFGVHGYAYDDLYQLKSASHPGAATESYSYDAAGNRAETLVDADNALAEDAGYIYSHDYNGNLLQKVSRKDGAATTYGYDYENRLVQVDGPGLSVTYKYDVFGRRIEKNVNGQVTQYVYDGANIAAEYDGSDNVGAKYTHNLAVDDPLAVQQGASTYYYHKDGLGSVTALTDVSGKVVKRYLYRSFGEIYSESGSLVQPYTFTGRERDSETGLYYYRARYYDPRAGRFITKDPIGLRGGINLYRYVRNNPIKWIDPYGLFDDGRRVFHNDPINYEMSDWWPAPLGHGDMHGWDRFDWTKEDYGETSPLRDPARHFQSYEKSQAEVWDAVQRCDKDAFERATHRLQDYYSHAIHGYAWNPQTLDFGHFPFQRPDTDTIYSPWHGANEDTKRWVQAWDAKNCDRKCKR